MTLVNLLAIQRLQAFDASLHDVQRLLPVSVYPVSCPPEKSKVRG